MFCMTSEARPNEPIFQVCTCGRRLSASDWLDLAPGGLMMSGDEHFLLDLRHCACGSTISVEVPYHGENANDH